MEPPFDQDIIPFIKKFCISISIAVSQESLNEGFNFMYVKFVIFLSLFLVLVLVLTSFEEYSNSNLQSQLYYW